MTQSQQNAIFDAMWNLREENLEFRGIVLGDAGSIFSFGKKEYAPNHAAYDYGYHEGQAAKRGSFLYASHPGTEKIAQNGNDHHWKIDKNRVKEIIPYPAEILFKKKTEHSYNIVVFLDSVN